MLVVEFDAREHNYLVVENEPYFVLHVSDAAFLVTRDRCPHRGGPLHLGAWDSQTRSLTCPWHGACLIEPVLARRAVPAVRRGSTITALFPVPAETP